MKMKKMRIVAIALAGVMLAGCGSKEAAETKSPDGSAGEIQVAFLVDRLGDNAMNDETYRGIQEFEAKTGLQVTAVEAPELQDHEMNARSFAQEGYDLIVDATSKTSELYAVMAPEFPETHFVIMEGTVDDQPNVTSLRGRPSEGAFLVGAFNVLMNQALGGEAKAAYIGGIRNPDLERSQYGFTAGAEYVGGEATVVYVGNFTDVAKGKEIALQLYNNGMKLVHAFAGGAGMGVYQAAESMGEDYYALGGADGQFKLSNSILASNAKLTGTAIYDSCMAFYEGTLEGGMISTGIKEGGIDILFAPGSEEKIPTEIKDQIMELREQIINGELVPPMTEEEYNSFSKS